MTTGGPPAARPPQRAITPVPTTPPRARPGQATTALSHHIRSHTQRPTPPSKVALVRSWIGRTKVYLAAAIGVLTLIVTIVSLLPSFAGGKYGKESLELALWTARKDYVEACQTYLNHTNVDCQQALEQGLPPPPGLDRFATRSLQKLKFHVQWLEIQPLTHETDDHVVWLRLWLQIGTIVVALILTGQWNRFIRLVRRQWIRPWFRDQADDLAWSTREQKGKTIGKSAILRAHGPSQAISTGISVEEGHANKLRRRTKAVASEAITLPTGKERVEKECKRRDREEPVFPGSFSLSLPYYPDHFDAKSRLWVAKIETLEYSDAEFGFCEKSEDVGEEGDEWYFGTDRALEVYHENLRPAQRPSKINKALAAKQAQRRNRGITSSPWQIPRREKRNPRKGKGFLYSHSLDECEALDSFENAVPY